MHAVKPGSLVSISKFFGGFNFVCKSKFIGVFSDATYFQQFCLLCYQDHDDGYTQLIRFSDGEHYSEIKEDLDNLIKLGVQIESITSDGHKRILKAIRKAVPDVLVQRCLVHIQRMCLLCLRRFPRHVAGVELRQLVLMLLRIKTENDRLFRTMELELWFNRHQHYLQQKTINELTGKILVHS